jgi:hypothetical protein
MSMTAVFKKSSIAGLAFVAAASAMPSQAAAQYGLPPSPLVSENQLMALGCAGPVNRNFQKGTLDYVCDAQVLDQIAPSRYGAGPRCSVIGRDYASVAFRCRENQTNYDQDFPRAGRDFTPRYNYPYIPDAPRRRGW